METRTVFDALKFVMFYMVCVFSFSHVGGRRETVASEDTFTSGQASSASLKRSQELLPQSLMDCFWESSRTRAHQTD